MNIFADMNTFTVIQCTHLQINPVLTSFIEKL